MYMYVYAHIMPKHLQYLDMRFDNRALVLIAQIFGLMAPVIQKIHPITRIPFNYMADPFL